MRGAGARGATTLAAAADRNRNRRDAASRIEAREQAAHTRAGARLHHNLPRSTTLRDVWNPVACVFAWGTVWSVVHRSLTEVARRGGVVPTVQHSMMVSAMSLLLVFRTNSAHQRFAEGRGVIYLFVFDGAVFEF